MTERAYGIDLGTTRSCIAYIGEHDETIVVKNLEGRQTTPSVVYFPRAGEPVVGAAAKRAAREHPELVVEAVKREMGLEWVREFHGKRYSPEDVSAAILKQLVADAERETGDRPSKVVITVPASFTALQKDATREAARMAGLDVMELLPEPVAAALTYGRVDDGILVYDLGGGTFDATLVDIEEQTFTALGTEGDQNLGGREWDWDVAKLFAQRFSERTGVPADDLKRDPVTRGHLLNAAEAAKIELAYEGPEGEASASTTQEIRHGDHRIFLELTLEQFDFATRHRVMPTIERVKKLLSNTGFDPRRLTRVLLVGGSTLMPQVQAALREHFPRVARDIVDPHMAVAKGAAIRAHDRSQMEIRAQGIEQSDEIGESGYSDNERNWFGLLGLDTSEDDPERIEAAINVRRLEWSRQTSDLDPDRAHGARRRLALVPAMKRELLFDAERRRKRAGTARRATRENRSRTQSGDTTAGEDKKLEQVRRQIGVMKEHGHPWKPGDVAKLAREYSIDRMQVEELLKEQNIVLEREFLTAREVSDIALQLKEDGRGAADLYHFLNKEASSAVGPDTECKELKERARKIFLRSQNTHPARGSLANLAMRHFENEREKRRYDRTLARLVIRGPELAPVWNGVFFDEHATEAELESLLTAAAMLRVTREMAREAILKRAEEEGWTVATAESRSQRPDVASSADRDALMGLYHAAGGTGWKKSVNWGTDAPLRDWFGVTVDDGGRVIRLSLDANNLTGTIPPELGGLANLYRLSLGKNNLTGTIPPELGGLISLEVLSLHNNELSGAIPPELGNLANLCRLSLGKNNLTGTIPPELGGLTKLEWLYLHNNKLSGTIPPELGGLTNLKWLSLNRNNLPGSIPLELASLNVTNLFLDDRNKPKPRKPRHGPDRDALMALYRSAGGTGWNRSVNWGTDAPIRNWFGVSVNDSGRVISLSLQANNLTGTIPPELGGLVKLQGLWLNHNKLTGSIPSELGGLANLKRLYLGNNKLSGSIPPRLGSLTRLQELALFDNNLSGTIPRKLGGLANLETLRLHQNNLSGTIPRELGRLTRLQELDFSGNNLSGTIPRELSGLTNLKWLSLNRNNLTGFIPLELASLNVKKLFLDDRNKPGFGGSKRRRAAPRGTTSTK